MRTHVFIVNDSTFPSHLKYMFAGTGARDKDADISLLSDIKRVRPGDLVIFYIEATTKTDGGFYGVFKIADQEPLVFHVIGDEGNDPGLGKKLIYRTLIEPYDVYESGVPEWEALDKLPVYSTDIQWSLICRKLKGKRGCTPILPWEAGKLIEMIRNKNSGKGVADSEFEGGFDWDVDNRKIVVTGERRTYPENREFSYDVLEDIKSLRSQGRAYETQLELYFTENIGLKEELTPIVGENLFWFGNQVACGVGMRKIDVLAVLQEDDRREFRVIELKDEAVSPNIISQLQNYVNWGSQDIGRHLEGAYDWNIQPIAVGDTHNPKNWPAIVAAFKEFNAKGICLPVKYFEYRFDVDNRVAFEELSY